MCDTLKLLDKDLGEMCKGVKDAVGGEATIAKELGAKVAEKTTDVASKTGLFATARAAYAPTLGMLAFAYYGTKWDAQAEKNQHPLIKTSANVWNMGMKADFNLSEFGGDMESEDTAMSDKEMFKSEKIECIPFEKICKDDDDCETKFTKYYYSDKEQADKYFAECISNENCDNLFKCLKGELKFKTEEEIEKEKEKEEIKQSIENIENKYRYTYILMILIFVVLIIGLYYYNVSKSLSYVE